MFPLPPLWLLQDPVFLFPMLGGLVFAMIIWIRDRGKDDNGQDDDDHKGQIIY